MMDGFVFVRWIRCGALVCAFALLAACATPGSSGGQGRTETANPHYKIGKPYQVKGRTYFPKEDPTYNAVGVASWYGDAFHGKLTANGEIFDKERLSAAHTTLPMPSMVEVENLENGRRTVLRVNDRGPFVGDRIIDLSHGAARALGFENQGLARVRVRYLGRAELAALAPPGPKSPSESPPRRVASRPSAKKADPLAVALAPAATTSEPQQASGDPAAPDVIAQLIGEADVVASPPAAAAPATAAAAPAPAEIWIDVRRFHDLNELEAARLALATMGSARVRAEPSSGGEAGYLLQLGPFIDQFAADARLAALREAGYPEARISTGPL